MIKYNPTHCKYSDGVNMRPDTQQNQSAIDNRKGDARGKRGGSLEEEVQFSKFTKKIKESKYRRVANSRLCGNLKQIDMHLKSAETGNKYVNVCKLYGKAAYSKCSICGFYLHLMASVYQ